MAAAFLAAECAPPPPPGAKAKAKPRGAHADAPPTPTALATLQLRVLRSDGALAALCHAAHVCDVRRRDAAASAAAAISLNWRVDAAGDMYEPAGFHFVDGDGGDLFPVATSAALHCGGADEGETPLGRCRVVLMCENRNLPEKINSRVAGRAAAGGHARRLAALGGAARAGGRACSSAWAGWC
jgi:hypothetical protein